MTRFLVVDDSPTIRMMLVASIRQATGGPTPAEAADRAGAIEAFRQQQPEVVFLDLMLAQGEKGTDVLSDILQERPDCKVVVVTALPRDHPEVMAAISHGAFGYLQKPARVSDLVKVLNSIDIEAGRLSRIR